MPNSFGPFSGFAISWLVRKTLKRCQLITVRESISHRMLKEIGITSRIFPDLGFIFEKNGKMNNNEINKIRYSNPERKLIGITARPYRFPNDANPSEKYNNYLESLLKFSKWLYQNNFVSVFIEQTLSVTSHESDKNAILNIILKMKNEEYFLISNNEYNCRDLKYIYSKMDYVVGTRFHSVIFSLAENIPSIAITYGGNKGQGIMKDLDLQKYAIPISEISGEKLIKIFKDLCTNEKNISSMLYVKNQEIKNNYLKLFNLLKKCIN